MPSSLIAVFIALAVASVIGVIVALVAFMATEPIPEEPAEDQLRLALKWIEQVEEGAHTTRRRLMGASR
jgi:hypothetical protein